MSSKVVEEKKRGRLRIRVIGNNPKDVQDNIAHLIGKEFDVVEVDYEDEEYIVRIDGKLFTINFDEAEVI